MERLRERDRWMRRAGLVIPPLGVQLALNRLAGTDLASHLAYLDSVREYHESLKQALYPVIFRQGTVREVDWEELPRHTFSEEGAPLPALPELGTLLALSAVLVMVGLGRLAARRASSSVRSCRGMMVTRAGGFSFIRWWQVDPHGVRRCDALRGLGWLRAVHTNGPAR